MDYHVCNRSQDDIMKIPLDGSTFKDIEDRCPLFKEEPHNLKLSLAVNNVNPFREMRYVYSVWPVFVINKSIPPWMSIKREYIILAMILPITFPFNSHLNSFINMVSK